MTFAQIADDFLNFITNKKKIIHNASFDLSFLNGELELIKKDKIDKKFVMNYWRLLEINFPVPLIHLMRFVKDLTSIYRAE